MLTGCGIHPRMVRVVRVVRSGTRKRKVYRRRSGTGAIVHRPIRVGIGIRRKARRTVRRVRPVVVGSEWQLSSTKRGTGRTRRVGRPRISRARVILV